MKVYSIFITAGTLTLDVWPWDTSHPLLFRLILFAFSKSPPFALFIQPESSVFMASLDAEPLSTLLQRWLGAGSQQGAPL